MSRKVLILLCVFAAFAFGLVATGISGFLYVKDILQAIKLRDPYYVGVSQILGYGFPWCWMVVTVVVYPGNPRLYDCSVGCFLLDVGFWNLMAGIVLAAASVFITRLRQRGDGFGTRDNKFQDLRSSFSIDPIKAQSDDFS